VKQFPDRPVVGVGGVVLDGSRVLLVKRGQPPLQGEWSLPGGAVELGETLASALVREVREETGIDVRVGPVVEVFERVHRVDDGRVEFHYVVVDYLCAAVGGSLAPGSDAADALWVDVDELAPMRLTATAMQVIAKARRAAADAAPG
jgi:mutator protein MutT